VTIRDVQVRERDERLWGAIEQLCRRLAGEYKLDNLGADSGITAVRGMQKAFGFDPTRYRPSSEALLRRVIKGLGIYQINTAVDVNNWCSLEFLLPMCIYDLRTVRGQICIRVGEAGEEYQGIGRQVFQMEGKVIVTDDTGVMGNTVSDSERTKVTCTTQEIFLMIYAPVGMNAEVVRQYAELAAQRMVAFNGGRASEAVAITV
jgi:DNA/RNA-binding domain of Phe-tRNA-synthetase-like protein